MDDPTKGPAERVVLESKAELEAFLDRHGTKLPRADAAPTGLPAGIQAPTTLTNLDFERYQVAAVVTASAPTGTLARVVAIDDGSAARTVRTTVWQGKGGGAEVFAYHLVAVPRDAKPLTFAEPVTKTGEPVKYTAVANPEFTQAYIEAITPMLAHASNVTKQTVVRKTLREIEASSDSRFSPTMEQDLDSPAWLIEVDGTMDRQLPGPKDRPPAPVTHTHMVISAEDLTTFELSQ
jgi:hypothetical protein